MSRSGGRLRIGDAEFPHRPGAYVVWESERSGRPLYVGVAATQTIDQRWRQQHLRLRAGGSALRRSLGPHLGLVERKLSVSRDGRFYPPGVEARISEFLLGCEIEFAPADSAEEASETEERLIGELRPLLNSRRPRVRRSAADRELLRRASDIYARRVKPALTAGLLRVNPDAQLDARGYVLDVEDNLLPGIDAADIEDEFAAGAGDELTSKMLAPWSSSALAVNAFGRWRDDPGQLALAGHVGFQRGFTFEHACPNGVSQIAPHLDVLLTRPGEIVAVESKCTEYLQGSNHPPVAEAYKRLADTGDPRASSRWFAALESVEQLLLLDGYQLVKHYLGLRSTHPNEDLTLVYLYWEPENPSDAPGCELFERHRREVAAFEGLVADDDTCRFVALSYRTYWELLESLDQQPPWLAEHLNQARRRYSVSI